MIEKQTAAEFGVDKMELEDIWPLADYITVHTPYMPQTHSKCTFLWCQALILINSFPDRC